MPARGSADATVARLAAACGIATTYTGAEGQTVHVPVDTLRAVLGAMGIAAGDPASAREAWANLQEQRARRLVPPVVVVRAPAPGVVPARVSQGGRLRAVLQPEWGPDREIAPGPRLLLPADLPSGYHRLQVEEARGGARRSAETLVVAAPSRCPIPLREPTWGWAVQLYAARSAASWGMGDLADLRTLACWSAAELGAGLLLVNPLHAATPVLPQEPSPYYPSSRRFTNPLYLRVADVAEFAALDPDTRGRLSGLAVAAGGRQAGRIDRDAVFTAKFQAFEALFAVPRSDPRQAAFSAYRRREGQGLRDFATFCALAERHGTPWQSWPATLRHPSSPAVAAARRELADRVTFHAWLQWHCDMQLDDAQRAATGAGMTLGIIHDLAVGVDPGGADGWALQDDLAEAVSVGAPPDAFNQRGQDWRLPPLRPDRLLDSGLAPFRDLLASVLRHAGGLRVDHILGLFRLFWIPDGQPPAAGTYVRYPTEELLGVLAVEAQRAGTLIVGEDLGTVEQGVRERLADWGVLSSQVLYFARSADSRRPLPAADYPRLALATVTTHDLPTAAGWWLAQDLRTQAELGLLAEGTTLADELARRDRERAQLLALLRAEDLVGEEPSTDELVVAMHAFLARTPSLLVAAALGDALGDLRQSNLPGTTDEHPNWVLALAERSDGASRAVLLDDLVEHPRVRGLARVLARRRPG
ncbi:MAG: 4-alpha-glucanotransferase [Actinomycetota bacterium]|nr:4-alpha-glucanotransferase [Actinomycetota bacterium]